MNGYGLVIKLVHVYLLTTVALIGHDVLHCKFCYFE